MVSQEHLHFNMDFDESKIVEKLTSQKPYERDMGLRMVMDFERLLLHGDPNTVEFQRKFRDCQLKYEQIRGE